MLVLSRKKDESITLRIPPSSKPQDIEVMVIGQRRYKGSVRLGFEADPKIRIWRTELGEETGRAA